MRTLSFASLRVSLLAAAGIGVAACSSGPAKPPGSGGAGGAAGHGGAASTGTGAGGAATSSSTSGSGGAGTGGMGTGGTAPVDPVCAGAEAIYASDGTPSGFALCPDNTIHRVEKATCDATIDAPACTGMENNISCQSDADCTAGPHGRCVSTAVVEDSGLITYCGCAYSCANDEECGAGKVCVCAGVLPIDQTWSLCANAACVTGADCATGECALSSYYNGCTTDVEVACRNPSDACRVDADCAGDGGQHKTCVNSAGSWQCLGWTCILGRPLMVDGQARTAAPVARGDWAARIGPDVEGIDARERAALARYWTEAAAMEHASVASFARFTLELLALGAPADLVREAQRAGADEVEHAKVAYGLASAYAGRAIGPGPLDLGSVRVATDRRAVVRALIEEACVGETLGVAEAMAFAEAARDPVLIEVHRRIAADEQRHAELAWRTLAWLLGSAEEAEKSAARRWFEEAIAAAGRDPGPDLLGAGALAAVRRQALREVVGPCAEAVLGSSTTPRASERIDLAQT
ncbi:MAG: ferritin-like domain-containing protein [Minicystis sp.]